jgi:sodium transport system permease protein
MTIMLTRSPRKTLLLKAPKPLAIPAAIGLAVVVHPVAIVLVQAIGRIYEMTEGTRHALEPLSQAAQHAPLAVVLLVFALVPAVCEELAFRGFILSGLRRTGHKWGAIAATAVFFGVAHGVLQQSLAAVALGLVLGFIAVQTGSLLPCILFHFVHNSLTFLLARLTPDVLHRYPFLNWMFQVTDDGYIYSVPAVALGGIATILLLLWFRSLPYRPTEEESLRRALSRQSAHAGAS